MDTSTPFQQNLDIGLTRKLSEIDDRKAGSIRSIQPALRSSISDVLAQPNVKVLLKRCTTLLLVGLLLAFSCNNKSQWEASRLPSSSKLCCYTSDSVNGFDLELLRTSEGVRAYLHVHSQAVPPYQNRAKEALVTLRAEGYAEEFIAARHEGGQCLLLPVALQEILLQRLQNNQPVTLELQGYRQTLQPAHFSKKLKQMQQPSAFSLPFHTPF